MPDAHVTENALDRRASTRFPLRLAISYRASNPVACSCATPIKTVNISSNGLLFEDNGSLQPGQHVQVSIEWPALLDRRVPLNLILEGRIVRTATGYAAMRVHRHEFKTRGSAPVPCGSETNQQTDVDAGKDLPVSA